MPPPATGPTGAAQGAQTSTPNTGGAGATPASTSGSNTSSAPKTQNYGMESRSKKTGGSDQNAAERLTSEQLFDQYGEDIFKHDRFKELTDYKKKFSSLDPVVQEFGSTEDLLKFTEYLGPVWRSIMTSEKGNQIWSKLYPVFMSIVNGEDIDAHFVQKAIADAAAQASTSQPAQNSEVTPQADSGVMQKVTQLENELKGLKQKDRNVEIKRISTESFTKYTNNFNEWCTRDKIPEKELTRKILGDVLAKHIIEFMPKGKNGMPLNPLLHHNDKAFKEAYDKYVLPAYREMTSEGVNQAVKDSSEGGPTLPNTNEQGVTAGGSGSPSDRRAKAARMAQYLNRKQ